MTAEYDLLVRGGRVLAPGDGLDGRHDVGVRDGTVVAVAPGLDPARAATVLDASDALVCPGLVDVHAHVYWGATSIGAWPDDVCADGGVTTVADGGSAGTDAFAGFRRWIVGGSRTRVLCHLNLSRVGLTGLVGELRPGLVDPDGVARLIRDHPDVIVGIKLRLSARITGGPCRPMLELGRRVSAETGKPLHVHIGGTVESMTELLPLLSSGDTVTHYQTPLPNGLLDGDGVLLPAAREARERGVLFDCGHGMSHFGFAVAEALLAQGFPPDTISSDLSRRSFPDLAPGLLTVMNKWLALGLPLPDVIRAATASPAAALGLAGRVGALRPGAEADLAVLAFDEGRFGYGDAVGDRRVARRRLRPVATVRAGDVRRTSWIR
ncbi:amidohydrolase/deacetylase family metallohydrolase [Actinomadura chibensis]|uniref:Amidohydrolase/deacetylase family metallohydrolase n=1 Tax=Actinomadura chibensis TaxID=392828 RepID=A0A5D0NHZ7_9ACTN|nr:amidohydrolase/deacetylase family metallohydrolase [Actinomadura chibensis]TYB44040.1 amidohydrolase/deacetylase family metallohydrolase [Actinomadura chibensis]